MYLLTHDMFWHYESWIIEYEHHVCNCLFEYECLPICDWHLQYEPRLWWGKLCILFRCWCRICGVNDEYPNTHIDMMNTFFTCLFCHHGFAKWRRQCLPTCNEIIELWSRVCTGMKRTNSIYDENCTVLCLILSCWTGPTLYAYCAILLWMTWTWLDWLISIISLFNANIIH